MNRPITHQHAVCIELTMSDLDKTALTKRSGKTSVVLYIVPRDNTPEGATHTIYQGVPGLKGEQHPKVGYARFYAPMNIPTDLPL